MSTTWNKAVDWIRNNYQDYSNIISLLDAMECALLNVEIQRDTVSDDDTWIAGDDFTSSDKLPCAGIHIGAHGNAIEFHAHTLAEAQQRRDRVLKAIQPEAKGEWRGSIQQIICDLPIPDEKESRRQGFVDCKMAILDAIRAAPVPTAPADKGELPKLPWWSLLDNLGGLVPSAVRQELRAYGQACILADRARQAAIAQPKELFCVGCGFMACRCTGSISDDVGFVGVLGQYSMDVKHGKGISATLPLTQYIDRWHAALVDAAKATPSRRMFDPSDLDALANSLKGKDNDIPT